MTTLSLDSEIELVREHLRRLEAQKASQSVSPPSIAPSSTTEQQRFGVAQLTKDDVERFSRQMLCADLGPLGTKKLRESRVLVVGAGGLGTTICMYLAAGGVGTIRICEFDVVERSNLHRQVIHNEHRTGMLKALSAKLSCEAINPHCQIELCVEPFSNQNAEQLVDGCDLVLDASDNVASRYLVNDAAVLHGKPLVSGSAMRWEGQLTVYHWRPDTPCYRCVFPKPPPAATVGSCNETGVIGPVPGTIGCLQAIEAIKILGGCGEPLAGRMLLFNALHASFKVIKLRPRSATCEVCGPSESATITKPMSVLQRSEYQTAPCLFSAVPLEAKNTISVTQFQKEAFGDGEPSHMADVLKKTTILDVRVPLQFDMAALPNSRSIPLGALDEASRNKRLRDTMDTLLYDKDEEGLHPPQPKRLYVVCRRGLASSQATALMLQEATPAESERIFNVTGGLSAFAQVDPQFPQY